MKDVRRRCVSWTMAGLVAAAVVSLCAIDGAAGEGAKKVDIDGNLYLGEAIHEENLTVWPVFSRKKMAAVEGEFVTLADAQEGGAVEVREVGKAAPGPRSARARRSNRSAQLQSRGSGGEPHGVVGELVVENRGDKPILVLAGTLLKGGKQDRQVGQDFVVPARKTVAVSAFCVERGRWTTSRNGKSTGGVFKAEKKLATKAVRGSGQYEANQNKVWENVARENAKAGKNPGTGTLFAAVDAADARSKERRKRFSKKVGGRLAALSKGGEKPVGLAYAVDGKVREVRSFTHPRIFELFAETLLGTVALEADLAQSAAAQRGAKVHSRPARARQVVDLVKEARKTAATRKKSKAGNVHRLRKGKKAMSSECFEDEAAAEPVTSSYMFAQ